jgi:hypothetical protein
MNFRIAPSSRIAFDTILLCQNWQQKTIDALAANGVAGQVGGDEMPAYFIVQSTISDEAQYQKYREAVVPMMMKHGAKFVVRSAHQGNTRITTTIVSTSMPSPRRRTSAVAK